MGEEEEKKAEAKKVERGEKEGKKEEGKKPEGGEKMTDGVGAGEKKQENKEEEEEGKREEGDGGENKAEGGGGEGDEGVKKETPPPPVEIVMLVYMHCEGCARKVKRSLKGFEGVEDVTTDCRTHKVVVKGKVAAADPLKVVDRVEKKSGRKVELLTPVPPKPEKKEDKKEEEKEKPKPEEKEEPPVICAVLKVHMHCEACSQEIKKRILKMNGVQSVDPDLKSSQVTVKGVFEPPKLVEYVHKRTGKHAVVVKVETVEMKPDGDKGKDDGKGEEKGEGGEGDKDKADACGGEGGKDGGDGEKDKGASGGGDGAENKEGDGGAAGDDSAALAMGAAKLGGEVNKSPFYYYYYQPRSQVEYAYLPQIFSDENPNACSVM